MKLLDSIKQLFNRSKKTDLPHYPTASRERIMTNQLYSPPVSTLFTGRRKRRVTALAKLRLAQHNITTVEQLSTFNLESLQKLDGIGVTIAEYIMSKLHQEPVKAPVFVSIESRVEKILKERPETKSDYKLLFLEYLKQHTAFGKNPAFNDLAAVIIDEEMPSIETLCRTKRKFAK